MWELGNLPIYVYVVCEWYSQALHPPDNSDVEECPFDNNYNWGFIFK